MTSENYKPKGFPPQGGRAATEGESGVRPLPGASSGSGTGNPSGSTLRYASAYKPNSYQPPERQRAFRPRSDLTAVRGILQKVLARKGLAAKASKYEFILHWPEIVGPAFVTVSKPECILKDTLVVRVISSGWAQEMGFVKPILLQKLARYLPPGQSVREVTFRVGPL